MYSLLNHPLTHAWLTYDLPKVTGGGSQDLQDFNNFWDVLEDMEETFGLTKVNDTLYHVSGLHGKTTANSLLEFKIPI